MLGGVSPLFLGKNKSNSLVNAYDEISPACAGGTVVFLAVST